MKAVKQMAASVIASRIFLEAIILSKYNVLFLIV
ncbi:unnamed protein product [Brugia timori]|uniref:Uncharacterized protein n=1 Tax=Brugia timori TaxID=42155 RepID=A0A0R3QCP7_9BILA|nr:unnamed protein product [Brugia timori]